MRNHTPAPVMRQSAPPAPTTSSEPPWGNMEALSLPGRTGAAAAPTAPWFQIHAQAATEPVEILMYDAIGQDMWGDGTTAKQFVEALTPYRTSPLQVRINSVGGEVFDGLTIYNTLVRHAARVDIVIDGIAASIASIIAMAGDSLSMPDNTMLFIHNPWALVAGDARRLIDRARALEKAQTTMVDIYAKRATLGRGQIQALMDAESWITAREAQSYGWCSDVRPAQRMAAALDVARLRNVPEQLRRDLLGQQPQFQRNTHALARLHARVAAIRRAA
jgi:ATP-dependent Clp protease, protease subunit